MATFVSKTNYRTSPVSFVTPGRSMIPTPASLVEAVQAAVQQVEESRLRPIVARTTSPAFQSRVLLAVLTYCYARQTYGASEILNYLIRDESFSKLCQGGFPNVHEIGMFRRQNRSVIERCLIVALRFLGEQKVANGFVTRIHETFIAEEAKRRIIVAACIDSVEFECADQLFLAVAQTKRILRQQSN